MLTWYIFLYAFIFSIYEPLDLKSISGGQSVFESFFSFTLTVFVF